MKLSISKEKFLIFIEWFVILQPLLDFLTSLSVRFISFPLTIGMIFRILFVGMIGIYFLLFYSGKFKKHLLGFYIAVCGYGVVNISFNALTHGFSTIMENSKMFFKMYYFVFVLLFFYALYQEYGFVIKNKFLAIVFVEYTASIFLSAITNTSFVTYSYGEGYCGWFYAANEVGAIVSILAIIALIYAITSKSILLKLSVAFLTAFVAVYIGTKVPFLSCVGAVALLLVFFGLRFIIKKDKKDGKISLQLISVLLITVLLFQLNSPMKINGSTMAGEHYESHVTDKLEQDDENEEDINDDSFSGFDKDSVAYKAFLMANWILSNRLVITAPAFESFGESSVLHKLVGMGYIFKTVGGKTYDKLIEMDFVALIINHGFLGTLLYLIPIMYLAVICIKKFFAQIKSFFSMKKQIAYIYSILIALGCAVLAGHVLIAPSVSIYLAIIIIKLYASLNKKTEE